MSRIFTLTILTLIGGGIIYTTLKEKRITDADPLKNKMSSHNATPYHIPPPIIHAPVIEKLIVPILEKPASTFNMRDFRNGY